MCYQLTDYLLQTPIDDKLEQIIDCKNGNLDTAYKEEALDTMTYAKWFRPVTFLTTYVFAFSWFSVLMQKIVQKSEEGGGIDSLWESQAAFGVAISF